MGKQTKSRKSENFGKGKVTPVQVAFIVDRYLSDNSFSETRSVFRSEASSIISRSPVREAPKSLLSLDAMLNEYICLKEQKVMVEQEKSRLDQEKFRVHNLLQGMQHVMNCYNSGPGVPPPMIQAPTPAATATNKMVQHPFNGTPPPGCTVYTTPTVMPISVPSSIRTESGNNSTPLTSQSVTRKRRGSEIALDAPQATRRTRSKTPAQGLSTSKGTDKVQQSNVAISNTSIQHPSTAIQMSNSNFATDGSTMQVSSVAKCLFNKPPQPPPSNTIFPKTPAQTSSSPKDNSTSPPCVSSTAIHSNTNNPPEISPANRTMISTERILVSPSKKFGCYTVERSQCISSSSPAKSNTSSRLTKRDHVKGRLDFDASDAIVNSDRSNNDDNSTSESDKETNLFDMDFADLDAFGGNFSFSDLFVDFEFGFDGIGSSYDPTSCIPIDTGSGSSPESGDNTSVADQIFQEYSSTLTEMTSANDMHTQGQDSLTAVKSITKCIRIVSPVKKTQQQNILAQNQLI